MIQKKKRRQNVVEILYVMTNLCQKIVHMVAQMDYIRGKIGSKHLVNAFHAVR